MRTSLSSMRRPLGLLLLCISALSLDQSVPLGTAELSPRPNVSPVANVDYVDTSRRYEQHREKFKMLFETGPVGLNDQAMSGELSIDIGMSIQDDAKKRNCFVMSFHSSTEAQIISEFEQLMTSFQGQVHVHFQDVLKGSAICFPGKELPLELIREIKWLKALERDRLFKASQVQSNASFGLSRLSGADLPLNGTFGFDYTGKDVHMYILDTAINVSHPEFTGRASSVYVAPSLDGGGSACSGHGTEVASLAAGKTVGVAKMATILSVAVLDCNGDGYTSDIIAGLNWVVQDGQKPAVINMSLGGPRSAALDSAVSGVANKGCLIIVAAGNENQNACNTSPANNPNAISVGASTAQDARAPFSNYGPCVNILAPGQDVQCANASGGHKVNSGTSFSAPYVAGVIALLYQKYGRAASSASIKDALFGFAVTGKLSNLNGSPNVLLQAPPHDPGNKAILIDFDDPTSPPPTSDASVACIILISFAFYSLI